MTPECPKGQESNLPPRSLRDHVAAAIAVRDGRHLGLEPLADATYEEMADEALKFVGTEVERLAVEVGQLRTDMRIRQGALNDVLGRERSANYYSAVEEVAELKREVSRLREQLAAAREALERVGCQFDMCTGPVAEVVDMRTCFVCDLLGKWGVSSSEAEAPQPQEMTQHAVDVDTPFPGAWAAWCPTCRVGGVSAEEAHALDWKDQHEADTLRPVAVTPEQAADQLSRETQELFEGRPSGSGRLVPRPVVLSNVIAQLSEARDKWQAMADEHRGMGWPEQANGVLLPSQFSDQLSQALLTLTKLWPGVVAACSCSPVVIPIHQSTGECWDAQYQAIHELLEAALDKAHQAGVEELAYGSAQHAGDVVLKLLDLLSEDAAQAARSEATPRLRACVERWPACEEGAYNPSCCRFPKSCSCTIYDPAAVAPEDLESPSPSLRKEGEDTAGSASSPSAGGDSDTTPRQFVCDQTAHSAIPCVRCRPIPRVWNKGDDEPADHPQVQDCHGDVWSYDENTGMWDTPETVQCHWHYIAKKWSPLTEVLSCTEQEEK